MAKFNSTSLRTFALILLGYGIGTALSGLELAAITGSNESVFKSYVLKGIAFAVVSALFLLYIRTRKERP